MLAGLQARGYTTFDLADHYGPAEDLIGLLNDKLRKENPGGYELQAMTKWVPRPGPMTRKVVEAAIDVSLRRMKVASLNSLQFHWWDYGDEKDMLDAMGHLHDLVKVGKIKTLALTNFDTAHVADFLQRGLPIASNQVQFSMVDMRPAKAMAPLCAKHGVYLFTYGTLMGGLLTDKWLGRPEPKSRSELPTPSLGKYYNMVRQWGSWDLFQELLRACRKVADRHSVSIANVAIRWVLDQPAVGGVIVGLRAGITEHAEENARSLALVLTEQDKSEIAAVIAKGNDLMKVIGDCGDEYRG
jgi:aryl-alcohol dehydrogenase-like predicted oxidoreductase